MQPPLSLLGEKSIVEGGEHFINRNCSMIQCKGRVGLFVIFTQLEKLYHSNKRTYFKIDLNPS